MKTARPSKQTITAALAAAVFLIAQIVLCAGPLNQPGQQDRINLGFPHLPTDHYAYMMYAEQTKSDLSLLTRNMFTTAPQDGRFLMLGLAAVGLAERILPFPDHVTWHGLRILMLAVFCVVFWKLCRLVFHSPTAAVGAFVFALFSGGLEWALGPLVAGFAEGTGADWANFVHNPWNFSIFFMSLNLVWVIPMTGIVALIYLELKYARTSDPDSKALRFLKPFFRGAGFALLWFLHPYSAIIWAALAAFLILVPAGCAGRRVSAAVSSAASNWPAIIGPAVVVLFVFWSSSDPVVAASNAQTSQWKLDYPVFIYPLVYGPWMVLPLFLIKRTDRDNVMTPGSARLLCCWLAAGFALTMNPVITGAKFQMFFFPPLALFEIAGLTVVCGKLAGLGMRKSAVAICLLIAGPAGVNAVSGLSGHVGDPKAAFAATADPDHLKQLEKLADLPSGGVLCDPWEGMIVPWKSNKPVFVGQWFLSTRFNEKADMVRWFYSGNARPEQLAGFLDAAGIKYVLYGPRESEYGRMPAIEGLAPVSDLGGRQIWRWR